MLGLAGAIAFVKANMKWIGPCAMALALVIAAPLAWKHFVYEPIHDAAYAEGHDAEKKLWDRANADDAAQQDAAQNLVNAQIDDLKKQLNTERAARATVMEHGLETIQISAARGDDFVGAFVLADQQLREHAGYGEDGAQTLPSAGVAGAPGQPAAAAAAAPASLSPIILPCERIGQYAGACAALKDDYAKAVGYAYQLLGDDLDERARVSAYQGAVDVANKQAGPDR